MREEGRRGKREEIRKQSTLNAVAGGGGGGGGSRAW